MEDINSMLANDGRKVEYCPIEKLKPYNKNNKQHGQKDLAAIYKSIERFGFADVIIADKDYEIIAGHGRLLAAKQAGKTHLPVLVTNMSKQDAKAYRIVHNRTANIAKYDDSAITGDLKDLKADGFELDELMEHDENDNNVLHCLS